MSDMEEKIKEETNKLVTTFNIDDRLNILERKLDEINDRYEKIKLIIALTVLLFMGLSLGTIFGYSLCLHGVL